MITPIPEPTENLARIFVNKKFIWQQKIRDFLVCNDNNELENLISLAKCLFTPDDINKTYRDIKDHNFSVEEIKSLCEYSIIEEILLRGDRFDNSKSFNKLVITLLSINDSKWIEYLKLVWKEKISYSIVAILEFKAEEILKQHILRKEAFKYISPDSLIPLTGKILNNIVDLFLKNSSDKTMIEVLTMMPDYENIDYKLLKILLIAQQEKFSEMKEEQELTKSKLEKSNIEEKKYLLEEKLREINNHIRKISNIKPIYLSLKVTNIKTFKLLINSYYKHIITDEELQKITSICTKIENHKNRENFLLEIKNFEKLRKIEHLSYTLDRGTDSELDYEDSISDISSTLEDGEISISPTREDFENSIINELIESP